MRSTVGGIFGGLGLHPQTRAFLEAAGFQDIVVKDTGDKYLAAYKQGMSLAASRTMPALGIHVFAGSATA
jgi:hypothetical protein